MRTTVVVSAVLLLVGVLLLTPAMILPKPLPYPFVILIYPGFAALLMSPVVLLATALASLVPSINARLENCQH
jgi:hypothetical protein